MNALFSRIASDAEPVDVPRTLPEFQRGSGTFLFHYVKRRWLHFTTLAILVVAAASCAIALQYVMKLLVDAMAGPKTGSGVWTALWIFVSLIAVESVLWRLSGWLGCRTTVGVGVDMRLDLFHYLNGQPMRYFAENLAGSLGQRITSTAGNFGALTNTMMWRILPPCVDFAGALIIFATVDWRMTLALAFAVVMIMTCLLLFGNKGRHLHQTFAAQANHAGGNLVDVISNMWAVKAFSARSHEHARLFRLFSFEAAAQRKSWMYTEKARLIHDAMLWCMSACMLVWAVYLWTVNRISPGDVVVVSALTFRILHGSRDMALSLVDMMQQYGFIQDTLNVVGQEQSVTDLPGAIPLVATRGTIVFDRVNFSYNGGGKVLGDLSLTVPAGQKIGIVGPSGAGKSTIVHLLQRLYDLDSGQILIDGQDISAVSQPSLRKALAVVPQEISLFHRSVMENISFARPQASEAEIREAAKAARCDGFIRRLDQGYETIVGERGTKLSGGQRQRVGIARAFLKDAPIIVFDEATSSLDTESEVQIQQSVVRLMRDKTVIAVAHRLSTLKDFDRVIVVDGGRIVEDGTVDELRARRGMFDRMWRLQAEGLSDASL